MAIGSDALPVPACIVLRLHVAMHELATGVVGVESDQQINIYSFTVHCDQM